MFIHISKEDKVENEDCTTNENFANFFANVRLNLIKFK